MVNWVTKPLLRDGMAAHIFAGIRLNSYVDTVEGRGRTYGDTFPRKVRLALALFQLCWNGIVLDNPSGVGRRFCP